MEHPTHIHIAPKQVAAPAIEHILIPLRHRDRLQLLHDILVSYNPYLAIVFVNTRKTADEVANGLIEKGLKVGVLHGDLTPRERKR